MSVGTIILVAFLTVVGPFGMGYFTSNMKSLIRRTGIKYPYLASYAYVAVAFVLCVAAYAVGMAVA